MQDPGGRTENPVESLVTLQVTLFGTNCYVLKLDSGEAAVVDPGGEGERILAAVNGLGGRLEYILCTHGHLDHIEAAGTVRSGAGGRIVLHEEDTPLWRNLDRQAQLFGLPPPRSLPDPDTVLSGDGGTLPFGPIELTVRHVPGHSPGSVAFLLPGHECGFIGDTVFSMGVGRVDLWGGNGAQLKASVVEKLFSLPESMLLYPGHGPAITVAQARRARPLLDSVG
jgi:glyoxylase-like metal-dependent hydrolase (beta-lactamase superfamily II)